MTDLDVQILVEDDSFVIEYDETHPTAIALKLHEWDEARWHQAIEEGIALVVEE